MVCDSPELETVNVNGNGNGYGRGHSNGQDVNIHRSQRRPEKPSRVRSASADRILDHEDVRHGTGDR